MLFSFESEVVAQLVRASLLDMCRAEQPRFEPRSDYQLVIGPLYIVLYQFVSLRCPIDLRTDHLGHTETGKVRFKRLATIF